MYLHVAGEALVGRWQCRICVAGEVDADWLGTIIVQSLTLDLFYLLLETHVGGLGQEDAMEIAGLSYQ